MRRAAAFLRHGFFDSRISRKTSKSSCGRSDIRLRFRRGRSPRTLSLDSSFRRWRAIGGVWRSLKNKKKEGKPHCKLRLQDGPRFGTTLPLSSCVLPSPVAQLLQSPGRVLCSACPARGKDSGCLPLIGCATSRRCKPGNRARVAGTVRSSGSRKGKEGQEKLDGTKKVEITL